MTKEAMIRSLARREALEKVAQFSASDFAGAPPGSPYYKGPWAEKSVKGPGVPAVSPWPYMKPAPPPKLPPRRGAQAPASAPAPTPQRPWW